MFEKLFGQVAEPPTAPDIFGPSKVAATYGASVAASVISRSSEPQAAPITPIAIDQDVLTQHAALSAKLGIHSDAANQLTVAALETFLSGCGYRVYDEKQVGMYLTKQYGAEQTGNEDEWGRGGVKLPTWGWRPLRDQDGMAGSRMSMDDGMTWVTSGGGGAATGENGRIHRSIAKYHKPIPMPVLLTVERVVEKFPDVQLYVSDEIHAREFVKDPFLMVVHLGKHYIIERWDEPNYRER